MIYQKIKSRLFNNNMLGTLLWSFYSSDKSSCKSASIMMIFVIQETTQNLRMSLSQQYMYVFLHGGGWGTEG